MNTITITVTCAAIDADVPGAAVGLALTPNAIGAGGMVAMYAELETELSDIEVRNLLMGATYVHPECGVISTINTAPPEGEPVSLKCAIPHAVV